MIDPHGQVNFKLLQAFVAIAEYGTFRQAAEALNKSQSVISVQIRQLEEQLAVPLFHRTTRRVELTREGQELLGHARRAMAEWDLGLRQIQEAANIQRGRLSLACVPTVASTCLPRVLAAFKARHAGIELWLREMPAIEMLGALRERQVDIAIGPAPPDHAQFDFHPVGEDPILALYRTDMMPLATSLSLADLGGHPVLLNTHSAALRLQIEQEFAAAGQRLEVAFEVLHTHTLISFALAGLGIAILPGIAAPGHLAPEMCLARIEGAGMTRTLGVVTNRGQSLSPAALAFRDAVEQALGHS